MDSSGVAISIDTDAAEQTDAAAVVAASQALAVKNATYLGSILFNRGVSGTRIVAKGTLKEISGHQFVGYGASADLYPDTYMTAACSIGLTRSEVDTFITRLERAIGEYTRQMKRSKGKR